MCALRSGTMHAWDEPAQPLPAVQGTAVQPTVKSDTKEIGIIKTFSEFLYSEIRFCLRINFLNNC